MASYNEELSATTRFLRNSGALALKAKPGKRSYVDNFKPSDNTQAKSAQLIADIDTYNEDTPAPFNIAAQFYNDVCSIDVDTKDHVPMVNALMMFLPQCNYVWGREKRPATHFAFNIKQVFDRNLFPILTSFRTMDGVNLELKGGSVVSGHCSIMPPSTIESKDETDKYIWHNIQNTELTPVRVDVNEIINAMRFASVASLMSAYWHEGIRQELTMALAGGCHRAAQLSGGISDKLFRVDLDDVLKLIEAIGVLSGDDRADFGSRQKAVRATWNKANEGRPTTGFTRIAELTSDREIVQKLYTLISDSGEIEELIEFTSRFVIKRGHALVYDTLPDIEGERKTYMTKAQFQNSYADRYITFKEKRVLLPDLLWKLSSAQRVDVVTFDPNMDRVSFDANGLGKLNLWEGLAATRLPSSDEDASKEIIKYLEEYTFEVLANADAASHAWIMTWIMDLFQNPSSKPGTSLVTVGEQGSGKTFLGEVMLSKIIGGAHYGQTNSLDRVTRDFNALFSKKLLIQCDESTRSTQRSVASKMRALITDKKMVVEPKGVDPFFMPSLARFYITSNFLTTAVAIDSREDRRFSIVEVSNKYKRKYDFWDKFAGLLDDERNIRILYDHFTAYEIDRKIVRYPLDTQIRLLTIQASWSTFDKWLANMVEANHPLSEECHHYDFYAQDENCSTLNSIKSDNDINREEWPDLIYYDALLNDFHTFLRAHKKTNEANEIGTVAQLRFQLNKCGLSIEGYKFKRVSVSAYDERKKRSVKLRVYLSSCFARQEVIDYLNKQYGWVPPGGEDA